MSDLLPANEGNLAPELAALYEREHLPMLRLASLLVGSRSIAEEIVHDAFVVVAQRWGEIDRPGGYLRSTVVNNCRMANRRAGIEQRVARPDPTTVEASTELIELRWALARLSERGRAAIVLRYFADLPDSDIAELLGCRVATVRSIVHRSLKVLRKELS